MKDDMEIEPALTPEANDQPQESKQAEAEFVGDELRTELGKEAGHIVVNPLADDIDFSLTDGDDDDAE